MADAGEESAGLAGLSALLGDSDAMVGFLKSALAELEAASGGAEDAEARALLLQLREQTAVLQAASARGDAMDARRSRATGAILQGAA